MKKMQAEFEQLQAQGFPGMPPMTPEQIEQMKNEMNAMNFQGGMPPPMLPPGMTPEDMVKMG